MRMLGRLRGWALDGEGSTRSAALIRIGLALNLWARFGSELSVWQARSPVGTALAVVFWLSSGAMLVGAWSQITALIAGLCVSLMIAAWPTLGGDEGWSHHHVVLLATATILIAMAPCGRSYSLDRWRALRKAAAAGDPPPREHGPWWALRLIVIQLTVVYFFTALDKSHLAFLSGARIEHYFLTYYWGSEPPRNAWWHWLCAAIGTGTLLLEYSLCVGLPFARTRRYLVWPGIALHGVFYLVLPVRTFTATVWVMYLAYFDPDEIHRVIDRDL